MLDNIDIAILTKLNALAERYGIKPYDFVATVQHDEGIPVLRFETPAQGNTLKEARYEKMLEAIGVDDDTASLQGSVTIIDALDNALQTAPNMHPRF